MARTTGSLVVRIAGDMNDFSRTLTKMTRDVTQAAERIGAMGKRMTIGITVPATLAAVALARMGAENEQVSRKMQRVFGPAAEQMQENLDRIMQMVPETGTELQKMAIDLTEVGDQLGFGETQSRAFTQGVMGMAASISAAKMMPFAEAVGAVEKAMMGQTKGLKQAGIVLTETEIKQEAMRLGLVRTGQQLTSQGTALATYSLLMQKTASMTKEVGSVQADAAMQMAFLKRDVLEFADATSNLLVPALRFLIGGLRQVVDWMNEMPKGMRETIIVVVALAAALGPLIVAFTSLIRVITVLRTAVKLLMAAEGIGGLLAALAAPEILAALAAIALVVGIAAAAWRKYAKDAKTATNITPVIPGLGALRGRGNAPTATDNFVDPVDAFRKRAQAVMQSFQQSGEMFGFAGQVKPLRDMVELNREALGLYTQQKDKMSEMALAAQQIYIDTRRTIALSNAVNRGNSYGGAETRAAVLDMVSMLSDGKRAYAGQDFDNRVQEESQLQFREFVLSLPSAFNPARVALLEFRETVKRTGEDFSVAFADFKQQWTNKGNATAAAMTGLKQAASGLMKEFSIVGLVLKIINDILSGIGPELTAVFSPFKQLGQMIGTVLAPAFQVLYTVVKYLVGGIGTAALVIIRIVAWLHQGVAKLFIGLGNLINKLSPGNPGNPIKKMGEGFLRSAEKQHEIADNLYGVILKLRETSWEDALNGVDELGDAARQTAEELLNVPDRFKYALRAFQATQAIQVSPNVFAPGSGPNQPTAANVQRAAAGSGPAQINIQVSGKTLASISWEEIRRATQQQFGNASLVAQLSRIT